MDPDEQPADAAVREAFEETGLLVEPTRIIGVYAGPLFCLTYPNGDVVSYVGISFAARVVGGSRAPLPRRGRPAGLVRPRRQALALPMAPHTAPLIEDAFAMRPRPRSRAPLASPAG